jgi:hypothetical protein
MVAAVLDRLRRALETLAEPFLAIVQRQIGEVLAVQIQKIKSKVDQVGGAEDDL